MVLSLKQNMTYDYDTRSLALLAKEYIMTAFYSCDIECYLHIYNLVYLIVYLLGSSTANII